MNTYQQPRINYISQLAILIGSVGVMLVISSFAMILIASNTLHVPLMQVPDALNKVENANAARWLNTGAAFFGLFVPAFIWARIMSRKPFAQMGFNNIVSGKQVFLVILILLAAMVLSNALSELNQVIPMPAKFLAKAKQLEKMYDDAVSVMASMKTTQDYLLSLFVIALCPAIFEEVLFRGSFQQILTNWTKKPWMAILITSIVFSAFHGSYFGFLSRAALGAVLGFIFYYSRNVWLNILLHFLNNAFIVTMLYSFSRSGKSIAEIEKASNASLPGFYIWIPLSVMVLVSMFIRFKKESERILPVAIAEEKDERDLL
jgi:membrane protease YdiL (CAAX protease family)